MRPSFARRSAAVGFFVASLGVATVPSRAGNARADWNALVDEFFEKAYFEPNPSAATSIGIHKYDAKLEDYSHASIKREIETLKGFEKRVEAFDPNGLDKIEAADRGILLGTVRSSLLSLETIRMWEKDANLYSGAATNSVYVIMNRKFAPVDDRLRSAVAREEQIPDLLKAGRANLKNPPRIYTEIAIEQLPGIVDFFEKDVPTAFADAKDPKIKADFAKSNATVIADLKSYGEWMKSDLLPRSNGDFRFGADTFSKKLLYDEDVDIPLDHLLEIGMADLHKNQAEFQRVAKEIDPTKSTTEVLAELQHIHPAPDKLLQTFRDTFDGLIGFIKTKHIITIPSDIRPILQETPPFERATTTASMDTPGPYEKVATEAYFNVTLPDPGAPPEEVEGMMENFNFGTIISTAIHETYPGHYVQFLWTPRAPTKIRKLLGAATNAEGWAHYCEQMMLDEGYGQPGVGVKDVRESRLIRLGQLQDALLRDARFVVGIQMHRGKMSFDEAKEFFVKEGYQSAKLGEIETKRGTSDATYLYYTLGKLEILKLREDYKRKMGADFTLQKFHDAFMAQGFPPIPVVRRALLGDSSPAL